MTKKELKIWEEVKRIASSDKKYLAAQKMAYASTQKEQKEGLMQMKIRLDEIEESLAKGGK